jgi:hypothetical protein
VLYFKESNAITCQFCSKNDKKRRYRVENTEGGFNIIICPECAEVIFTNTVLMEKGGHSDRLVQR